jgi:hypothetical protein
MDPYSAASVYDTNQNLKMEEDDDKKMSPEDTIKAFKKFLKEFQLGNTYEYR